MLLPIFPRNEPLLAYQLQPRWKMAAQGKGIIPVICFCNSESRQRGGRKKKTSALAVSRLLNRSFRNDLPDKSRPRTIINDAGRVVMLHDMRRGGHALCGCGSIPAPRIIGARASGSKFPPNDQSLARIIYLLVTVLRKVYESRLKYATMRDFFFLFYDPALFCSNFE